MTPEQKALLEQARQSLDAAKLPHTSGYHGFSASRSYYAMFYIAQAFLLGKGLSFSKHGGVVAAFGEHFAKTGAVSVEFHRWLIGAMAARHLGDYGGPSDITSEEAAEQIARAERFLALAGSHIR